MTSIELHWWVPYLLLASGLLPWVLGYLYISVATGDWLEFFRDGE